MQQTAEIMRGHYDECLEHLANWFNQVAPRGLKGSRQAKKPVADFCRVSLATVSRWLNNSPPTGGDLFKIICYMDMLGYKIIELERMQLGRRNFVELLGYSVISPDQALEILRYSSTSTLYKALNGQLGISEERHEIIRDTWKQYREELEIQKQALRDSCFVNVGSDKPLKTEQLKLGKEKPIPEIRNPLLSSILPLLEKSGFAFLTERELKRIPNEITLDLIRYSKNLRLLLLIAEERRIEIGENPSYQAIVEKIIPRGKHGPYAVTRSEELGTITFSLSGEVWKERTYPEPGMYVVLSELVKKRAGWRSLLARYTSPTDDFQENRSK